LPIITNSPNDSYTKTNWIEIKWDEGDDPGTFSSGIKGYILGYTFMPAGGGTQKKWSTGLKEIGNPKSHSGSYGHGEGQYDFYVKTVDNAGNESKESDIFSITYDKTAPIVEITAPDDSSLHNGTIDIRGTVQDNNPDHYWLAIYRQSDGHRVYAKTFYRDSSFINESLYLWDISGEDDGVYQIRLEARDKADNKDTSNPDTGNTSSVHVIELTIDNTAPDVPGLTSPTDGAIIHPSAATLNWTDETDLHGPVTYNYQSFWSGGGHRGPVSTGNNSEIDATGNLDEVYNWQAQACDSLGNCSAWSGPWEVIIDGTNPGNPGVPASVETSPTKAITQNWNWTAATDNLSNIKGYYTGIWDSMASNWNTTWGWVGNVLGISTNLGEGIWQLWVKSEDNAGNQSGGVGSGDLVVDTTPPSTTMFSPSAGDNLNGPLSIEVKTEDEAGVVSIDLAYAKYNSGDGTCGSFSPIEIKYNTANDSPFSWTYLWKPTSDDTYCIKAYGTDTVGNVESSAIVKNVVYDTTAPKVNLSGSQLTNKSITKVVIATDDLSGINSFQWFKQSGPGNVTFGTPNDKQTTISADKDGVYKICLTVEDRAGNESTGCMSLTLDTIAPIVLDWSIEINKGDNKTEKRTVDLDLFATEASQMMISNNASFAGISWEDYATYKSWKLTEGDGHKVVYAKFKDKAGNESTIVSNAIILDKVHQGDGGSNGGGSDDTGILPPVTNFFGGVAGAAGTTIGDTPIEGEAEGEAGVIEEETTGDEGKETGGFVESGDTGDGEGELGTVEGKKPSLASLVGSALWPDTFAGKLTFGLLFLIALGILWFLFASKKRKKEEEIK